MKYLTDILITLIVAALLAVGTGLNTITGIISRWAPASENNTQAYINSVAQATGVTPDQPVDTTDSRFMVKLLQAIIRHENGVQPYDFGVLVKALALAGT
ncbi:hypothetical protein ACQUWL_20955 [Serratia marcescens]|uniref:hypothetical protein n=1 Tax=Serratia marcescens TaxID=615 RepID=UPI003D16E28F